MTASSFFSYECSIVYFTVCTTRPTILNALSRPNSVACTFVTSFYVLFNKYSILNIQAVCPSRHGRAVKATDYDARRLWFGRRLVMASVYCCNYNAAMPKVVRHFNGLAYHSVKWYSTGQMAYRLRLH